MKRFFHLANSFRVPLAVLAGILMYFFLQYRWHAVIAADVIAAAGIIVGSAGMVKETVASLARKQFVLDYIALLAIIAGLVTQQYLVALVIVLMLSSGTTLEKYGLERARQSLTALTQRIPHDVMVFAPGSTERKKSIEQIRVGEEILVRKGEVVPLDGVLISAAALIDESSLTGEPYLFEKMAGDAVPSGTVNTGDAIVIKVTKPDAESTYRKIIEMVKRAQREKAPLLRLADRYSTVFTLITLALAVLAYVLSHDNGRILAVLVVATPCPLILAAPIALFGGMNSAARRRILVKKLGALEALSRVTNVIFDKTGTITLGLPLVSAITILDSGTTVNDALSVAAALERNSLHPLAKAINEEAKRLKAPRRHAERVAETVGAGISAVVDGRQYSLAKMSRYHHSNAVELFEGETAVARFEFEDKLKQDARDIIRVLKKFGLSLYIFTGDREENAAKIINQLGAVGKFISVKTNCTPEGKKNGIAEMHAAGRIVAMVGDGINDAPALALADVGLVFSNEEHTAASEAADIVFLGGDLALVWEALRIAHRTIRIALEGIFFGIGLSVIAMIFAAFGYIPPIEGAILQEAIDVVVILNALRASRALI